MPEIFSVSTVAAQLNRLRRFPLTRDQIVLLLVAMNEFFLGLDTYLAHNISGTIRPNEWIPILFGPIAGVLLLLAGLLALKYRSVASTTATVVLLASIVVGLLGAYFHGLRGTAPTAPPGQRISIDLLVWAPPVLGPLMFSLVGLLGISAAWIEEPPGSGRLRLPGGWRLQLPYSKTRAFYFVTTVGILVALVSSVLDHARAGFENPAVWIPLAAGIFGVIAAFGLGVMDRPGGADKLTYIFAMLLLILVGVVGAWLHVQANLTARSTFVPERFLRGAPVLGPLLFANMGVLGLISMLELHKTSDG